MTIKEAKNVKIGDFVKIINTHNDKKSNNDKCIWMIVGTYENVRERNPITLFDIRLLKGSYWDWRDNKIVNEGEIIRRTNRALKEVKIKIEEV